MTLGERLNTYLAALDQKQNAVAADWLERYKKKTPKARWELDTIISHLNRCLKEKREGVKFFFEHDALRSDLLLEILRVPQAEHAELRRLARECLEKEGDVTCRLVIDATTWGSSREQSEPLFLALKEMVLQPVEKLKLTPVALIITEQQYDWLPRSYDKIGDWLLIEQVNDQNEGWSKLEKLAGDGALVASSRRYQPTERWLAMEASGIKALAMEPAQGLEVFAAQGRLPAPPAQVAHPLEHIAAVASNTKAPIPSRPCELRRIMLALGDEAQVLGLKLSPAERLALAQALGVPATSTKEERLEHELAGLATQVGADPKTLTRDELEQLLARAQRREVEFSLLRVEDELHVLNPPPSTTLPQCQRLIIHRMTSRRPAINRLMEVIDKWTADDYAADRGLTRVIERLDPKGEERLAFLHARACLVWSSGLCPPSAPVLLPDWKSGLGKLLAGEPPAAQLRLSVESEPRALNKNLGHYLKPFLVLPEEKNKLWPSFVPAPCDSSQESVAELLRMVPAQSPLLADRKQTALLLDLGNDVTSRDDWGRDRTVRQFDASYYSIESVRKNYRWYKLDYHIAQSLDVDNKLLGLPQIVLPHNWKLVREGDLWLDLFDCSRAMSGANPDPASWERVRKEIVGRRLFPIESIGIIPSIIEFPESIWSDADRELALCWLALKTALVQGQAVKLHDGIVLLSMGAGLFARISIRRCSTVEESSTDEQQVRGCLDAGVRHGTRKVEDQTQTFWEARLERREVTTHRAMTTGYERVTATTTLGYELPVLYLAGYGLRAEISFLTSPLFLSYGGEAPPVPILAAAGVQALAATQRENQRRADEAARYDDGNDD